jgi:drug/metabolite transporter (DMT)-like permease|tara:strand:+ start:545 stop:1450 length:906 start_codon:yes stop_codon:yes gene_type:complete
MMSNRDWFLIISLGILWGASFLFVEVLLDLINPFLIVYFRVSIASIILVLFLYLSKTKFKFSNKIIYNLFIMALLNNVVPFLMIAYGQQTTTGGLASILNANTSLITILLASMFISYEKLTVNRLFGVLVGLFGIIIAVGYESFLTIYDNSYGKFLILLATVSYAFAGIWAKLKLSDLPPLISATGMLTFSTVILSPFAAVFYYDDIINLNFPIIFYSVMFAILCSVIAYFLYFKILEKTGAGNLLICTIIIPPASIILNSLILGQVIAISELIGLMIITVGLIILDGRYKKFVMIKNKTS